MVSLKENTGTVITRDKRRAAGSLTRICPSNHGKHEPLWRAGKGVGGGDEGFCLQAPSAAARAHPPLQGGTDSPSALHCACDSLFTRITMGL